MVRAIYLGDDEDTAWAEWYRHTSEAGVPPARRLPRETWRVDVDLDSVADLAAPGVLRRHGIARLDPSRRQWPKTQPIGEAYWTDGAQAVLAPSAAHRGGQVLAVFRPSPPIVGLTKLIPSSYYDYLPPIPTGLRT
jgi:RES domain-containing protein